MASHPSFCLAARQSKGQGGEKELDFIGNLIFGGYGACDLVLQHSQNPIEELSKETRISTAFLGLQSSRERDFDWVSGSFCPED